MNIAIVLAGGSGSRLGGDMPKQFMKVAGKKIIEHTLDVFDNNQNIDEIAIVTRHDYVGDVEQMVVSNQYRKVKKILCGGRERYHSSLAAINAYDDDETNLIFHDAVRPLVSDRIINDCIDALQRFDAVGVGINATDTIWQTDEGNCISAIPPRTALRCAQTPQCFKRGVIRQAYEKALCDAAFAATDDCGVVRAYMPDVPIYIVNGEVSNIKVTYPEDLLILEQLLQIRANLCSKNSKS